MARPIEHQARFGFAAERVLAAFTDETYLRERLAAIGGRSSELVSHDVSGSTTRAVMRQGIDPEHLPTVVRRVTPDGVVIERTETWYGGPAPYRGSISATVAGMPGSLEGTLSLADTGGGSVMALGARVRVGLPLVGGRIETVIAEQLSKLLEAESRFTTRWLERGQG